MKNKADIFVDAMNEESYKKRAFPMSWIFRFFKPYMGFIILSFVMAIAVNVASLAGPYIIKLVIDDHLTPKSGNTHMLIILAFVYLGVSLFGAIIGYFQENVVAMVGQKIVHKMRTELFNKIQLLTMSFFDHNSAGRILTRLTSDIDAMSEMFSILMISLFTDGVMIIGIIGAMFMLSPKIALAILPIFPLIVISILLYKVYVKKNFVRLKGALSRINGFLAENISGMPIIKLFGREKDKNNEFHGLTNNYYKLGLREVLLNTFSNPYMNMINNITIAILFYIFAPDVIGGFIEIGVLYAMTTYLKRFFEPVIALVDQYTQIQSAFVSADRIYSIISIQDEENFEIGEHITSPLRGEIEFKDVWFAYNSDNYVIKNLSFKTYPGESIAFVGSTGSGKSTIISLIARFYKINSGQILLDGKDIYSYNLRDLRQKIAIILQEPFLFTGNIKDNITLGDSDIDMNYVKSAAELSGADAFIKELPQKYNSEVAERGKTFSAGQRQLISFARAAVTSPSIFILDEATANIDTETEEHIKTAMEQTSKGITTITVAHRLSTIKEANTIYVLDLGELKESGTHDELLSLGGIYANLYQMSIKTV